MGVMGESHTKKAEAGSAVVDDSHSWASLSQNVMAFNVIR